MGVDTIGAREEELRMILTARYRSCQNVDKTGVSVGAVVKEMKVNLFAEGPTEILPKLNAIIRGEARNMSCDPTRTTIIGWRWEK